MSNNDLSRPFESAENVREIAFSAVFATVAANVNAQAARQEPTACTQVST
jgi:hypothetical protein